MRKLHYNQSGLAHYFVLVLLMVSAVGFTAWKVKNQQGQDSNTNVKVNKQAQDNQKAENKVFSFSAAGDFSSSSSADLVLQKISEAGTDFTLALGDLGYGGNGTEATWCKFVTDRVGTSHPFELIVGNHDDGTKMVIYWSIENACQISSKISMANME